MTALDKSYLKAVVIATLVTILIILFVMSFAPSSSAQQQQWGPSPRVVVGTTALVSGVPSTKTITFAPAFVVAPVCTSNDLTSVVPLQLTVSSTQITITGGATVTDDVSYICVGNPN